MKVYNGSGWVATGSTISSVYQRFEYTASGGETSVTGADDNANTLAYDAGFIMVFLNGVMLNDGDYTATSGSSITGLVALTAGDKLEVIAHGAAAPGDYYSKAASDAKYALLGANTDITSLTLADGSSSAPALANTGDTNTGIFFPAADTVGVAVGGTEVWRYGSNPTTAKNILINGSCSVAQRGTVTSLGASGSGYTACDRFAVSAGGSPQGEVTASQDTDVPSGAGFGYSLKLDCTTAEAAVDADDRVDLRQRIEAQNLQHLLYGNAAAKTLSLSFWIKSPKSGTHCVALYQPDGSRSYVREFTVASADTWEKFTVTFPGDASGTINNDNGAGLHLVWPLVAGTNLHATADAWAAGEDYATSNQQNLLDNTANNIYITGVQLEVGSVATDFEHEDIGTTREKCLRYFHRLQPDSAGSQDMFVGFIQATSEARTAYHYPVRMRTAPSITFTAGNTFEIFYNSGGAAQIDATSVSANNIDDISAAISFLNSTNPFTIGEAAMMRRDATDTTYIDFDAEL